MHDKKMNLWQHGWHKQTGGQDETAAVVQRAQSIFWRGDGKSFAGEGA